MTDEFKEETDDFFEDLAVFIKEWMKNKRCKCDNPECNHYQRRYNKSEFRRRTDDLFNKYFTKSAKSFIEIAKLKEKL